jgi:DNA-binding FadR family transcriptional regulator
VVRRARRFAGADQRDLVEVRAAVEAAAARLAAVRRTGEDLRRLGTVLRRRERAWSSGNRDAFVDEDAAFHRAVVAAAHNAVLVELYADLGLVIQHSLRDHLQGELHAQRYVDHAPLVDAIRARDADAAAAEAAAYLR